MGFEHAPKMSAPSPDEVAGTRRGIDPQRPKPRYRGAGAWALGLGIPAICVWYIAPVVIAIAIVALVQASRTGDNREKGFAIGGLCLALLGILLAAVRAISVITPAP